MKTVRIFNKSVKRDRLDLISIAVKFQIVNGQEFNLIQIISLIAI